MRTNQKGFTLIELVVVIAILGVLTCIAVPNVTGAMAKAREGADRATALTIANAAKQYIIENNVSPGEGAVDENHKLVKDQYLESVPKPQNNASATFFLDVSGDLDKPVIKVGYGSGGDTLYPYDDEKKSK